MCSGEYGDYTGKMEMMLNERDSALKIAKRSEELEPRTREANKRTQIGYDDQPTELFKIKVIINRMWKQMIRNKVSENISIKIIGELVLFQNHLRLKLLLHFLLGTFTGIFFYNMGNDGSKTIFNFGFLYISVIAALYIPLLPMLGACEYDL